MIGKHSIEVSNSRVNYSLTVQRNITVIGGDSGTGKTTLVGMVSDYQRRGKSSGVTLNCDVPCVVLPQLYWQQILSATSDSIVFIDEGSDYVTTVEFAREIKNSSNYYVIITREAMPCLPYSIDEVYRLKTTTKSRHNRVTYTTTTPLYAPPPPQSVLASTSIEASCKTPPITLTARNTSAGNDSSPQN